jgi:DnaK suppressor protein
MLWRRTISYNFSNVLETMTHWSDNVDEARRVLNARKAEVNQVLEDSSGDSDPVELDQTRVGRLSRMDALQQQAMAKETLRRRELELKKLDLALARLDDDEYGYCVQCGDKIEPRRLDADPSVPICVGCAD